MSASIRLPLGVLRVCLFAAALAGCAAEPEPAPVPAAGDAPAERSTYPSASGGTLEGPAPCSAMMHIEHCIARLMEEGSVHCDPAAEPVPVVRPDPVYPQAARAEGIAGWVELEARVSPAGAPEGPRVAGAEPSGLFEDAALRAFRRWRYCPKAHRGKPVRARMRFAPPD